MKPIHITRKDFLFLSISFFIVVAAWIGFNIYHTWVTSTISEDLQMQITPIEGKFDTATIQKLKARKKVDASFSALATPSATVTLSPTPATAIILLPSPSSTPLDTTPTPSSTTEEDTIPTEIPTPADTELTPTP